MDTKTIPGAVEVPIGPPGPPQQYIALVPLRLEGTIAMLSHDDDFHLMGRASEAQMRDLAVACAETAHWLRVHTLH